MAFRWFSVVWLAMTAALQGAGAEDVHIHVVFSDCRVGPDRVFGKSAGVHYACAGGREICSFPGGHPETIQQKLVSEFEQRGVAYTEAGRGGGAERALLDAMQGLGRARAASRASAPDRLPPALVQQVHTGERMADVVARLGRPYIRVSGEGERGERLTYPLENGETASLEFEDGKVAAIRILRVRE